MRIVGLMAMIIIFCSGLLGMHYIAFRPYSRVYSLNFNHWIWLLIFLALSYFLASLGVRFLPNTATRYFYISASVWLGILILLFATSAIYELVNLITYSDSKIFLSSLLAIVAALSIYGLINANILTIKRLSIPISGLSAPLKIVQLSDIHVGTVHRAEYLHRIVDIVNAEDPDMVLITGDLFDGSAKIDTEALDPLNTIKADVYFSIGNHEVYEGLDNVRSVISTTKLRLLENEKTELKGIQIIGVNDPQSRPHNRRLINILQDIEFDKSKPTILMYHPPQEWMSAKEMGIDLVLSGHTHRGQIMPFNLMVKPFFPKIYGLYEEDGRFLYTTSGTGTWGPPMRIGSNNEIVVISLLSN